VKGPSDKEDPTMALIISLPGATLLKHFPVHRSIRRIGVARFHHKERIVCSGASYPPEGERHSKGGLGAVIAYHRSQRFSLEKSWLSRMDMEAE
jgi:hypothetical protein